MVLEVDLHDLVGEAEHHCMPCAHPLLHVHDVLHLTLGKLIGIYWRRLVGLGLFTALKVTSKVLKKCDLLLEFLGVLGESVFFADILSVSTPSLVVVEMIAVRIEHDLGGVVKINTRCLIGQIVSETVFRRIVDPLLHPHFIILHSASVRGAGLSANSNLGSRHLLTGKSI